MSASKIWTQSGDWWILIIHDVILVFTSCIDKNQNGERREELLRSTSFRIFNIYQVIWSLGCNWSPNSGVFTKPRWCARRSSHRIWRKPYFSTLCCCSFDWKERATDCVGCLPFEKHLRRPNCWGQKYGYSRTLPQWIYRKTSCVLLNFS